MTVKRKSTAEAPRESKRTRKTTVPGIVYTVVALVEAC